MRITMELPEEDYVEFMRQKPRGVKKGTYVKMIVLSQLDKRRAGIFSELKEFWTPKKMEVVALDI